MKHFYFSLLFLLIFAKISIAQTDGLPSVEKSQFTYHLLFNASYEAGVSRLNTIRISGPVDIGFLYQYQSINGVSHTQNEYYARPSIAGEFRHYYNLNKRQTKGKRVDKNSGNFIAPVVALYGPAFAKSDGTHVADFAAAIGGLWGIQRNYGKTFNFQLSLGPGIGFAEGNVEFAAMGQLSLGFRIGN